MSYIVKNRIRDLKVEILRVIASIVVVCYHIRSLPYKIDNTVSETNVMIECFCSICVLTFFLISGFYIYNKNGNIFKDWFDILKNFFIKIFIPFYLLVTISLVFNDFFLSSKTLYQCIKNFDLKNYFNLIYIGFKNFNVNSWPGTSAHLWYVFSYLLILLVYPINRLFLTKTNKYIIYIFLLIITLLHILNDYLIFNENVFIQYFFDIFKKPIYFSEVGFVLYNDFIKKYLIKKDSQHFIINRKIFIFGLVLYVYSIVILFIVQYNYYTFVRGVYTYTSWLSSIALFETIGFIILIYCINFEKIFNEKLTNIIYFISKRTLGIYLIHYFIVVKLYSLQLQNFFYNRIRTLFGHILYFLLYGTFIFIVSLLLVLLFEFIFNSIKKRFLYVKKERLY